MTLAIGIGVGITFPQKQGGGGSQPSGALDTIAASWSRPVFVGMIGDSHMLFDGYGFASGLPKNLVQNLNMYATPIFPGGASYVGEYLSANTLPPGAQSGAPSEQLPFLLNSYTYADGSQASGSGANGVNITGAHDLNPAAALRANYWYSTFLSGGGSFTPGVLNTVTNAGLASGGLVSANTGAVGRAKKSVDVPAGARASGGGLKANWAVASGGVTQWTSSPMLAIAGQIERPDRLAGLICQTLYGVGGQSLLEMASYFIGLSDAALTNLFTLVREQHVARGYDPRIAIYINSGHNDKNRTSQMSIGPSPAISSTPEGYIDNLTALVNRFISIWNLNGWPLSELFFWSVSSYPLADPAMNAALASYAVAAKAWAAQDPASRSSTALTDYLDFTTDVSPNLKPGDPTHSLPAGYDLYAQKGLAARVWERLPGPVYAETVAIDGVVAVGQTITSSGLVVKGTPTVARQWLIGGVEKAGATGTSYVVQPEDAGKSVQLRVTLTLNGKTSIISSNTLVDQTRYIADYSGGLFYAGGVTYASEAAWRTALGFTLSGSARYTTTPVLSANSMGTNAAAFTPQANVSIADVTGGIEITRAAVSATKFAYQQVTAEYGEAYQVEFTQTTISGSAMNGRVGNSAGSSTYYQNGAAGSATVLVAPGSVTPNLFVSFGDANSANNGVGRATAMAVKKARRYPGIASIAETILLEFTPNAGQTVDEVLWQADTGVETNRRRIVRTVSDGHVRMIATNNGTDVANIDLGAAPAGVRNKLATRWATNDFHGCLNGVLAASPDTAGNVPGVCYERHGRSVTGDNLTGTLDKVQAFEGALSNASMQAIAPA